MIHANVSINPTSRKASFNKELADKILNNLNELKTEWNGKKYYFC